MKGLVVQIYRTAGPDCTNGGVSVKHDEALVIGEGIPEIFDAHDRPVLRLVNGLGKAKTARLVPVAVEHKWTMFGGNFAFSSDGRFRHAVDAICGAAMNGAVPIHDRVED